MWPSNVAADGNSCGTETPNDPGDRPRPGTDDGLLRSAAESSTCRRPDPVRAGHRRLGVFSHRSTASTLVMAIRASSGFPIVDHLVAVGADSRTCLHTPPHRASSRPFAERPGPRNSVGDDFSERYSLEVRGRWPGRSRALAESPSPRATRWPSVRRQPDERRSPSRVARIGAPAHAPTRDPPETVAERGRVGRYEFLNGRPHGWSRVADQSPSQPPRMVVPIATSTPI